MKRKSILMVAVLAAMISKASEGQDSARAELSRWIVPGWDEENYVRALQTLGLVERYPWSARSFSSRELRLLTPTSPEHPWSGSPALRSRPIRRGVLRVDVAPLEGRAWYNTAIPYGMNDGAVWVGRGLTVAGSAGVSAEWGPVELTLAPEVFWAENRSFALLPTGDSLRPFADPLWPNDVDRPQRFGNSSYSRIDAGRSGLRIDLAGVAAGISNAHESWGPMSEFPLIMGTNAPGFPHVFLGTSQPVDVWVGRVHGRVIYARLEQSEFSPATSPNPSRFASGMVAVFEPRFLPGLELGASRFFHVAWPDSGVSQQYFTHIFQSFLKQRVGKVFAPFPSDPNSSTDNQLASVFARWVLPGSGFELYGEFGREDHNRDPRDLMLEPEQNGAYAVGAAKVWKMSGALVTARAEVVNFQASIIDRHRAQNAWYRHTFTEQGHTNRGQLLATALAVGSGGGSVLSIERVAPDGMIQARWLRELVRDPNSGPSQARHVLEAAHLRALGHNLRLRTAANLGYQAGGDPGGEWNAGLRFASAWYP